MHVFRLMDMPDRVIAFENLPESMVTGFEMCRADGFPRHWKEWLGKRERKILVPSERDQFTGGIRKFDPIVENDFFFYLVDYTLRPIEEKWKDVCAYVKQNVSPEIRLKEVIDDMAIPLASNKTDGVSIEPEDVPVIKLRPEVAALVDAGEIEVKAEPDVLYKCTEEGCVSEYPKKQGLKMHIMKKHPKKKAEAAKPVLV